MLTDRIAGKHSRLRCRDNKGAISMKRALLCGAAALALAAAASAEGYVSGNYADIEDTSAWSLNGRALLGEHVLLDGGYSNLDGDVDIWRVGGHLIWRSPEWLVGGYIGGAWADASTADVDDWVVAGEGQYHTGRMTLAATVAYSEMDTPTPISFELWNVNGAIRYFVTDNFSLEANAAWLDTTVSPVGVSESGSYFGLGAEYQFESCPVSIFAAYRHTDLGAVSPEINAFGVGLRWNFGEGTLMQRDRSGLRLRRPEGAFEVFSGGGSLD
jgi:hypothetical protein